MTAAAQVRTFKVTRGWEHRDYTGFAVHSPTKFPLIDYGFTVACGHCTKKAGSYTSVVAWQCPTVSAAISNHPTHERQSAR